MLGLRISLRHTMMRMSRVITLVGGIAAGAPAPAFPPCPATAAFSSPASASLSAPPRFPKQKSSRSAKSSPLSFLPSAATAPSKKHNRALSMRRRAERDSR